MGGLRRFVAITLFIAAAGCGDGGAASEPPDVGGGSDANAPSNEDVSVATSDGAHAMTQTPDATSSSDVTGSADAIVITDTGGSLDGSGEPDAGTSDAPVDAAKQGTIVEFAIPAEFDGGPASRPLGIAVGPDQNLWFTQPSRNRIVRMTPAGVFVQFPLNSTAPDPHPEYITAGPDGNLWFTEYNADRIGRITPGGAIAEFVLPSSDGGGPANPERITAGPDGNLWFTESASTGNRIGKITPAGAITEYAIPTPVSQPFGIVAGPDGNLWFCETGGQKIGRITPGGIITEFDIPKPVGSTREPEGITVGPDGNLWFADHLDRVGKVTTAGNITVYPTRPFCGAFNISKGPDDALWYACYENNKIGRMTAEGLAIDLPLLGAVTPNAPLDIVSGPLGRIWFTEWLTGKIASVVP